MKTLCHDIRLVLIASLAIFFFAACGSEEDVVGGDDSNGDTNQVDEEQPATGPDSCDEGQTYNPITGKCIDAPGAGSEPDSPGGDNQDPDNQNGETGPDENNGDEFNDLNGASGECGPGAIEGQTCRPDGGILPGATVTVTGHDCNGIPFVMTEVADGEGNYSFSNVPSGNHVMSITSGSFEVAENITVLKDQTLDRKSEAAKLCLQGTEVSIAVVTGTFDDIVSILSGLGIEFDTYGSGIGSLFADLDALLQYDIIFVECGASWFSVTSNPYDADEDEIRYNIARYIELGNSLYASDQAYRFINEPLPEAIYFLNESTGGTPTSGSGSQSVTADVISEDMKTLLGSDTAEVYFDMGAWAVMEDVGPVTHTQFMGNVSAGGTTVNNAPLMAIYNDPIGGGRAIYTSFHNTAQPTGDMQAILEFMIFQL